MTIAISQSAEFGLDAASDTTVAVTLTGVSAGSALDVYIFHAVTGTPTYSVADGTNTYTQRTNTALISGTGRLINFTANNVSGGSLTVTATFSAAQTYRGIYVREISGTTGWDKSVAQAQTDPGTGIDAITTGLTGTLTSQPALISGVCVNGNAPNVPTAGTGFTSESAIWTNFASVRPESKYLTATTSLAATWSQSGTSDNFVSAASVFLESASTRRASLTLLGVG